ncbi:MAG: DUF481 domain-containing protein [Bacteroidota bacterium]|nr:DUF481 domain-containing protein [Bacteroidota bacterium]MDX5448127.1 DUF481 domain-containing protein [Bacteroidota bacterium]
MTQRFVFLLLTFLLFSLGSANAQQDSLILINGDVIVGELKEMDRGIITFETDYSDSDFKIEWSGVRRIFASATYLITLNNGQRINGQIKDAGERMMQIIGTQGEDISVSFDKVVLIMSVDDGFLDRISANIDLGYSLTRANNQEQFTLNSRLGYEADRWLLSGYYNMLLSRQDEVADIQRKDGGVGYQYFLPQDWYLSAELSFLSNTQQALDLRTNARLGVGKFFVHTNQWYWGAGVGAAANIENFSQAADSTATDRQSWEGYIGTELNLFDIGDLNLFSSAIAYPSFTESGRFRLDFRFDAKYDLPLDFYVRAGVTVNYDNQPAIAGRETDYIFTTGFGWEW